MVKIRLYATGTKHKKSFRIVATEATKAAKGKTLAVIGWYDPKTKPPTIRINKERLESWLKNGAQLSPTVSKLLNHEKTA